MDARALVDLHGSMDPYLTRYTRDRAIGGAML